MNNDTLATLLRPKSFAEIVGQESIVSILSRQTATKKIKHAYLFCGAHGCGKTTTARVFANSLNDNEGHVIEIDAASNNGVDCIRTLISDSQQMAIDCNYKVYVIDECFTGDTLITTSTGLKYIKDIKPGDRVATLSGFNDVTYVHHKKVGNSKLNLIRLSNGKTLTTTANHLFLTTNGWIESKNLVKGDILLDDKNMFKLWENISDKAQNLEILQQSLPNGVLECTPRKSFNRETLYYLWENLLRRQSKRFKEDVLNGMQEKVDIAIRKDNNELRIWDGRKETLVFKNDKEQSDEEFIDYTKDVECERIEWNSSSMDWETWGQWTIYRTSDKALEGIRGFLGIGISDKDGSYTKKQSNEICVCIQSRPWLCREEVGCRGGWQDASREKSYCIRFEKGTMPETVRVDSVEVFKLDDNGESKFGCSRDTILYDLTVDNSPTYFANGVLVHNCHMMTNAAWNAALKLLEEPPKHAVFILCTTNPDKIPGTILSRVQRFDFKRIDTKTISDKLEYICNEITHSKYERAALDRIAIKADGYMRDAITNLDKCLDYSNDLTLDNIEKVLGLVRESSLLEIVNNLLDKNITKSLEELEQLKSVSNDLVQVYDSLLSFVVEYAIYNKTYSLNCVNIPRSYEDKLYKDKLEFLTKFATRLFECRKNVTSSNAEVFIRMILLEMTNEG